MTTVIDTKISEYIGNNPWLKMVLTIAITILGAAKARGWFALRYGIK